MEKFKYLRIAQTSQNRMHEEVNSRLNQGIPATIWSRIFCLTFCCL